MRSILEAAFAFGCEKRSPVATMDDFIERASIWSVDRRERLIRVIAQRDYECGDPVVGLAEKTADEFLVTDGRVAAGYPEVRRRQENAHRELPEVELNELGGCGVVRDRREKDECSS